MSKKYYIKPGTELPRECWITGVNQTEGYIEVEDAYNHYEPIKRKTELWIEKEPGKKDAIEDIIMYFHRDSNGYIDFGLRLGWIYVSYYRDVIYNAEEEWQEFVASIYENAGFDSADKYIPTNQYITLDKISNKYPILPQYILDETGTTRERIEEEELIIKLLSKLGEMRKENPDFADWLELEYYSELNIDHIVASMGAIVVKNSYILLNNRELWHKEAKKHYEKIGFEINIVNNEQSMAMKASDLAYERSNFYWLVYDKNSKDFTKIDKEYISMLPYLEINHELWPNHYLDFMRDLKFNFQAGNVFIYNNNVLLSGLEDIHKEVAQKFKEKGYKIVDLHYLPQAQIDSSNNLDLKVWSDCYVTGCNKGILKTEGFDYFDITREINKMLKWDYERGNKIINEFRDKIQMKQWDYKGQKTYSVEIDKKRISKLQLIASLGYPIVNQLGTVFWHKTRTEELSDWQNVFFKECGRQGFKIVDPSEFTDLIDLTDLRIFIEEQKQAKTAPNGPSDDGR